MAFVGWRLVVAEEAYTYATLVRTGPRRVEGGDLKRERKEEVPFAG